MVALALARPIAARRKGINLDVMLRIIALMMWAIVLLMLLLEMFVIAAG